MSEDNILSQGVCHAMEIYGHCIVSWKSSEKGHEVDIAPRQDTRLRCRACGSGDVVRAGIARRRLSSLPIGGKPVTLSVAVQRVRCGRCGVVRQGGPVLAAPRRGHTFALERYVIELSRLMTIQDVARHFCMGWDTVKAIVKRRLEREYAKPPLKHLRHLGIDEIHVGRMGKFLTLVMDWETGRVVYVGEGRGGDALKPFWKRLKASRAEIKAVCTDMSPAYTAAVLENLPGVVHVYDRFHVVKLFNEKLAALRRQIHRDTPLAAEKKLLKGTRWLLLKNPENLDEKRDEKQRLEQALAINKPLALAYYLKEDLRQLWRQPTKAKARRFLDDWIARAKATGIPILIRFANTMTARKSGILAWYDFSITNGPLEGTNNKIQLMKRQAYGYRDKEFFKLKIKAVHETRYALIG